jgi:hypothetical protein
MSNINFTCPHCSHSVQLPADTLGKQGNCPGCKTMVQIVATPQQPQQQPQQQPLQQQPLQQQPLQQQPLQQQPLQQQPLQYPTATWSTPTLSKEPPKNTNERQKSIANEVLQRTQDEYTSKPRQTSRGNTVLWLGILGFFLIPILCPIAWILGSGDLKKMRKGIMENHSADTTRIGCALGAIGTIFLIIAITIITFLIIYAASGTVPWWMAGVLS